MSANPADDADDAREQIARLWQRCQTAIEAGDIQTAGQTLDQIDALLDTWQAP